MAIADATIACMQKKRGRPPVENPKTSETISLRVMPEMYAALQKHVDAIKPKTSTSAVVALALEEYLHRLGLWPPPPPNE